MNTKLTAILATAILGLSACSGSGGSGTIVTNGGNTGGTGGNTGGSTGNANGTNATNSSNNNTQGNNNSNTSENAQSKQINFIYGAIDNNPSDDDNTPSPNNSTPNSSEPDKKTSAPNDFVTQQTNTELKNINELLVNGRSILVIPPDKRTEIKDGFYSSEKDEIYTGSSTAPYHPDSSESNSKPYPSQQDTPNKSNSWRMIGAHLKYGYYGEIYDEYEKRHIFAMGESTPEKDLPNNREVRLYQGKALAYTKREENDSRKPIEANSQFRVNFGDKTLVGTITPKNQDNSFKQINLKAVIQSNTFEGKDTAVPNEKGAFTKGAFIGPHAEEMVGAYAIPNEYGISHGTFGASFDKLEEKK